MLTRPVHALMAAGLWSDMRGANLLDSDASFYETYETAGARHAAVGCLEPCSSPNSQDCCRSTNVLYAANTTGHCGRR